MSMTPEELTLPQASPGPKPAAGWEPGKPAEPETEERSSFEQAVEKAGATLEPDQIDFEELLRQAGADMSDPEVQLVLQTYGSLVETLDPALLQFYAMQIAADHPAGSVTLYSQALEESGFGTAIAGTVRDFAGSPFGGLYGPSISERGPVTARFEVQPETGWIRYPNGVLVNPGTGQVFYEPNSSAPGSPYQPWLEKVHAWSEEKVKTWRERLVDFGYLSKEQGKVKGVDEAFLGGLRAYHEARYRNFGKPTPYDLAAGTTGASDFDLTAKDFQVQIRNDVREQFRRVAGREPSDAEVAEWARFTTQYALRAQKELGRKGASPEGALSLAATEAEETLIEELETSPGAEFMRESAEENTRLRDALSSAVVVTRSLTS